MRKTVFRRLLVVALLLGFPILLWQDAVSIGWKSESRALSSVSVPKSAPLAISVFVLPELAAGTGIREGIVSVDVPIVSSVNISGHLVVSTSSSAPLAALASHESQDSSPVSPSSLSASVFAAAPGFGGGAVFGGGGSGSVMPGSSVVSVVSGVGSGSSAAGRDFDYETCPLIDQSDFSQP